MKTCPPIYATTCAVLLLPAIAFAGPPVLGSLHVVPPTSAAMHVQTVKPQTTVATKTAATKASPHTGQPNQSCGSATAPYTPGNASTAPGSAFNPNGKAGTVYAGQQPQNSVNPKSVSQYDAACAHQPSK